VRAPLDLSLPRISALSHAVHGAPARGDSLKSELSIRPIRHQLEHRADAHVLIAFLAYCLQVTLKNRLIMHTPGLTPAAVLEKLATIQMVEVWIPMVEGRWLVMPRPTRREKDVQALLNHIPSQSPSRLRDPR
jgi:hypothetical protein